MLRRLMVGLVACSLFAQNMPEDLRRIRARVARDLNRLPNYTCLESIDRFVQEPASKRPQLVDRVRLEVALVDNAEMFAWPGSREFQSRHLRDLVSGGAIGNGSFALHAKSVFAGRPVDVERIGPTKLGGRAAREYKYHIPRTRSTFILRHGNIEAAVGYGGSFFVDPATDELMRLEVRATEIPPALEIPAEYEILDYQKVRLGDGEYLLPKASEMHMESSDGSVSLNRTVFSGCRQYSTESALIFADPTDPNGLPQLSAPTEVRDIPTGLRMDIHLVTPLLWAKSAVGDAVTAVVRRDVKLQKQVVIPKGSQLKGRLICLERRSAPTGVAYLVGVRFDELAANKWRATLATQLVEAKANLEVSAPMRRGQFRLPAATPILAGVHPSGQNVFVVYNEPRFTDGLDLVLATLPAPESSPK